MSGLTFLDQPAALLLYGAALFLALYDRAHSRPRGLMTILAAAAALLAAGLAIVGGTGLWEAAALLMAFVLITLGEVRT